MIWTSACVKIMYCYDGLLDIADMRKASYAAVKEIWLPAKVAVLSSISIQY